MAETKNGLIQGAIKYIYTVYILVGGFNPCEKYEVSWDDDISN